MTIWVFALLASLARASVVPAKTGTVPRVRVVPAIAVPLGRDLGLPLTLSLPQSAPSPFGSVQFKRHDAPTPLAAAPEATAAPDSASPAVDRPGAGLIPEEPFASGLPGLMPALSERAQGLVAVPRPDMDESADVAGRGLFDGSLPSAVPAPPADAPARTGLRALSFAPGAGALKTAFTGTAPGAASAPSGAERALAESAYLPEAAPDAVRLLLPAAESDDALRDAVASPQAALASAWPAGPLGGHAPLFARPSRLTLEGRGLVVRVAPAPTVAPGADLLLRGRPRWTFPAAPPARERRLLSTDLIERGALLEAVSTADAVVGRGLLAWAEGDIPGTMTGTQTAKPAAPSAPRADFTGRRRDLPPWLALAVLPLAAALAARGRNAHRP